MSDTRDRKVLVEQTGPPKQGDELIYLLAELGREGNLDTLSRRLEDAAPEAWSEATQTELAPGGGANWLSAVEHLALARRGADRWPGTPTALCERLDALLEDARTRCDSIPEPWLFGARAVGREDLLPWSALITDAPPDEGELARRAGAWVDGQLGPRHEARLRDVWRRDPVGTALRAALGARIGTVEWTSWPEPLRLSVRPVLRRVRFPHRDPPATLEIVLADPQVLWSLGDEEPEAAGPGHLQFEDPLGPFSIELRALNAGVALWPDRAAAVANELLYSGQDLARARALARLLAAPPLVRLLEAASAAFAEGTPDADALEADVEALFSARLDLESLSAQADDDELVEALFDLDDAGAGARGATLLIDTLRLRDIVGERLLDPGAWWGETERLDRQAPVAKIVRQIRAVGAPLAPLDAQVVHLLGRVAHPPPAARLAAAGVSDGPPGAAATGAAVAGGLLTGSSALFTGAAVAGLAGASPLARLLAAGFRGLGRFWSDRDQPEVGVVPLLLWDVEAAGARMGWLRVEAVDGGGLWGDDHAVGALAWDATRLAYAALSSLLPSGAPRPLEDHRFTFEVAVPEGATLDGRSLGLPVALALASCWTGRALPAGLCGSAGVDASGRLRPVGRIAEKLDAARPFFGDHLRLVVAEGCASGPGIEPVASLEQALRAIRLSLDTLAVAARQLPVTQRRRLLRELAEQAQLQDLTRHRDVGGANPWSVLAQRIESLAADLADDPRVATERAEALTWAAICYQHAGDSFSARGALQSVDESALPPCGLVLKSIAAAGDEIDEATQDADRGWATSRQWLVDLDARLAELSADDAGHMTGLVRSQQGRLLLHAGDALAAGPFFETAIAAFGVRDRHELPRTQVYLSMALRGVGDLDGARTTLDAADALLRDEVEVYDAAYAQQTRMYWRYERGRLAVAAGDGAAALEPLLLALRTAREGGWWPRAGVLRTLVRACRVAGRPGEEALFLEELRRLDLPPGALRGRLLLEAENSPGEDDEVY